MEEKLNTSPLVKQNKQAKPHFKILCSAINTRRKAELLANKEQNLNGC